jgi:DNA-directed RNA polymerase sigma subunit (sigma70/sigma32)
MQNQYKNLTPRRKEMMEIYCLQEKSLEEIGNKFGIGKERVRQIIKRSDNFKKEIIENESHN